MTNNPTIDGVSRELRELLERVVGKPTGKPNWDALDEGRIAAAEELRALLDAPAVERQEPADYPECSGNPSSCPENEGYGCCKKQFCTTPCGATCPGDGVNPCSKCPQSTIAQLEDKLNKAIDLDFQRRETIEQLQARVQELESGRGEPVATVSVWHIDQWYASDPNKAGRNVGVKFTGDTSTLIDGQPLFTAPPAPVAVVLPERLREIHEFLDGSGTLDGYSFGSPHPSGRKYWWRNELRACLDATAALNTVHVGELDPAQRLALARGEQK